MRVAKIRLKTSFSGIKVESVDVHEFVFEVKTQIFPVQSVILLFVMDTFQIIWMLTTTECVYYHLFKLQTFPVRIVSICSRFICC